MSLTVNARKTLGLFGLGHGPSAKLQLDKEGARKGPAKHRGVKLGKRGDNFRIKKKSNKAITYNIVL